MGSSSYPRISAPEYRPRSPSVSIEVLLGDGRMYIVLYQGEEVHGLVHGSSGPELAGLAMTSRKWHISPPPLTLETAMLETRITKLQRPTWGQQTGVQGLVYVERSFYQDRHLMAMAAEGRGCSDCDFSFSFCLFLLPMHLSLLSHFPLQRTKSTSTTLAKLRFYLMPGPNPSPISGSRG